MGENEAVEATERRVNMSNTPTVYTISGAWDITPDSTSIFIVLKPGAAYRTVTNPVSASSVTISRPAIATIPANTSEAQMGWWTKTQPRRMWACLMLRFWRAVQSVLWYLSLAPRASRRPYVWACSHGYGWGERLDGRL